MKEKPYNGPILYPVDVNSEVFSQRLSGLVNSKGYGAQNDIMRKTGISPSSLHYYMDGKHWPTIPMAVALADYFGVSLDWLTGRTDEIGGERK